MSNIQIPNLPAAIALNGTEQLEAVQSGTSVRITPLQIASFFNTTNVNSISFGATGLTPASPTTGAVTVGGTLNVGSGGTGSTSLTQYGLVIGNGTSALTAVTPPAGNNYVLIGSPGSAPTWAATVPVSAGVDSISFGSTGLTPSTNTAGVITVGGTLAVGSGGTGQSANLTQYGLVYGATTTAMGSTTAGTTGQVLIATTGAAPSWVSTIPTTAGVTSFSGGTTGLLPNSATTGAVSLSGTLIAGNGGTGQSTYAVGDLLYADTTSTLARLADVATGNALISGGVSTAPSWGKIGLTTHVSGTLPVGNGGTGAISLTQYGLVVGNGTSALTAVTPPAGNNYVLIGSPGSAPTWSATIPVSAGVDSISFGSTGLTPSTNTAGVVTVSGTLAVGNGGTGQASNLTQYGIVYGNTTTTMATTAAGTSTTVLHGNASGAPTFSAVSLTADVSGILPVGNGGTGQASNFTQYGVVYGSTTTALATTATGTTGQPLLANTTSGPAFGNLALGTANTNVTGTLTVTNGGTGAATFTTNGVLYGNTTSAIQVTAQGGANTILTANSGAPSFSASPTIGTSVTTPLVIGGTAAGSTLTLTSTTNASASGDQVLVKVGNNGATTAATFASTAAFLQLGAGTTAIAPLKFTSGTNLSTAAAGAVEYDGSVAYFSPAASTRSTIVADQIMYLGTAYTLTNATGVQKLFNGSTNGTVTLQVGDYQFECYATISSLPTTGTFGFAFAGTATYTQAWMATGARVAAGTAATPSVSFNTAANTAVTPTSSTTTAFMFIKGTVNVTVTGTLIPQFSMTTTSAAAVIGVGSFFKIAPLSGTNGTANLAIGNWS